MRKAKLVSKPSLRTVIVVVGLVALPCHPGTAQTRSDTFDVVLAAMDSVIGRPPFAHPGRGLSTNRVCLESFDGSTGGRLTESQLTQLKARLSDTLGFSVASGCRSISAPSFGTWIVDENREPAVLIKVGGLIFTSPDIASATISEARAGRWGKGMKCVISRGDPGTPFKPQTCEILFVS